jgi:hypothetical protein
LRKTLLALASLLALFLSLIPAAASAQTASGPDYDITNGHFYTEANGQGGAGGTGYAITDDGGVPMWTWFQKYGGVNLLGYPNTGRFTLDGFTVQGTQKALLQWNPQTQTMQFVNIFDRLHAQNLDGVLQATFQIPPQIDNSAQEAGINGATAAGFAQIEAIRDAWLNFPNPAFVNYYTADQFHVDHFGLPTSHITDFGPFITIRLQRTAFQLWKVDGPAGIKAGTLVQVNGSDIAKTVNFYPQSATTPSAPPSGTAPAPGPGPVTGSTQGLQYGFAAELVSTSAAPSVNATKAAGFGWIKQQVRWDGLQPSPNTQIGWSGLDNAVNTANGAGLKVMFSTVAAPAWAQGSGGTLPSPSAAATFFGGMAAHFKGRVQAYEIWNEENYGVEVGPAFANPGAYVEILKAVYPAIKAADPNAIVVSGAPTPTGGAPGLAIRDLDYINQMYAYQGGVVKGFFDALGAHNEPYGNQPQENVANHTAAGFSTDPSFFFRQAEDYRNVMVQNGDSNKGIWETEIGYDSNPVAPNGYEYARTITEQQQATWLPGLFQYAKANYPWMGTMFVWNLNYQAIVPQTDEKWGFGVLRADYSPRPAYTALATMPK